MAEKFMDNRRARVARLITALAVLLATTFSAPSWALNIVLSNDDGFEAANIRALYTELKAAGHDVVVSGPAQNNSGKGGAMDFLVPMKPLTKSTRFGTVKAGAPGAGAAPQDPNVFYVDGTPVMSLLYGLDVVAAQRWKGPPDLVISGPNEGANTGAVVPGSGTFNNAVFAVNRGIPAIAVSYAGLAGRSYTKLSKGAPEYRVADLVVKLVAQLEASKAGDGRLLPPGLGLNVNIPVLASDATKTPSFKFARLGLATQYRPVFYASLADSKNAVAYGLNSPYAGISIVMNNDVPPAGVRLPEDDSPTSEANELDAGAIPVSVFVGMPEAGRSSEDLIKARLHSLLHPAD